MSLHLPKFLTTLLALCLIAPPALAQFDRLDGEMTPEKMEILEDLVPLEEHKQEFLNAHAKERIEEEHADLMEDDPWEVMQIRERIIEEAKPLYREEYPDRFAELETHRARLDATSEEDDDSEGDDSDDAAEESAQAPEDTPDLETLFEGVDGEIAVYSRQGRKVTHNDGHTILQDDGHVIEFCYADTGCEDQSDVQGQVTAGIDQSQLHHADPDKEVVGLRLHLIVHPDSASLATLFVATGHTKDEFGNPFEIEDILFESRTYEPGDTVTYDIGDTD